MSGPALVPSRPLLLWPFALLGDFLGFFLRPFGNIMSPLRGSKDKKAFVPVCIDPGHSDPQISVYQVLYRIPELHQALETSSRSKYPFSSNKSDQALKNVFDVLQSGCCPHFRHDCEQHDAAEFMEQTLSAVSADVSQPLRGTLNCSKGHCIEDMSQFRTLPLPFTDSVEKGLQQMFDCNNTCKDGQAAVKDKKKAAPLILVFHLRRFDLKESHVKSDCEVQLAETLRTQGRTYALCAVVDHWDSVRKGHYTATVSENSQWVRNGIKVEASNGKKSSTAVLIIYRRTEGTSESYTTVQVPSPYHGLRNQGSTCYLNSVLQVLFMTPEIRKALAQPSTKTDEALNTTDKTLKSLFDKLQRGECGTEEITRHLQAPNVQSCAAQYLEILLNRLSKNVSEPFHGEFLDVTLCSKRHCINQETSKFWTLPLSMENVSSVSDGFQKFFEPKKLGGIHCNECEQRGRQAGEAISEYMMTKPPQVLVLLLKNFGIDHTTGHNYKSHREVQIPGTLPTEGVSYSLFGVVDHSGDLRGGHYTATIQSTEDGHWYYFNDSTVRKVRVPYERSSTAYLLLYRAAQVSEETVPSGTKSSITGGQKHKIEKTDTPTPLDERNLMDVDRQDKKVNVENKDQRFDHGHRTTQVDPGPFGYGSCKGQVDYGTNKGSFDRGSTMGQFDSGSSKGQLDHGSNKGQVIYGFSKGQFDYSSSKGQYDHGSSKGQFDNGSSRGSVRGQMSGQGNGRSQRSTHC